MANLNTISNRDPGVDLHNTARAVLFDRDGVLTFFDVDSAIEFFRPLLPMTITMIATRWQTLGAETGFPKNMADEKSFFAGFWNQLSDEFMLSPEQRATLLDLDYTRFLAPYPEVRSVLDQLRARDIKLGVLSNFTLASLEHSMVTTDLVGYFDILCAAVVIGAAKPSAQAYQIALDALQVRPEECLFFDDEAECVEGARKLGMRSYLVDRKAAAHHFSAGMVADLLPVPQLALGTG